MKEYPIHESVNNLFEPQKEPTDGDMDAQERMGRDGGHEKVADGLGVVEVDESGQKSGLQVEEYGVAHFLTCFCVE